MKHHHMPFVFLALFYLLPFACPFDVGSLFQNTLDKAQQWNQQGGPKELLHTLSDKVDLDKIKQAVVDDSEKLKTTLERIGSEASPRVTSFGDEVKQRVQGIGNLLPVDIARVGHLIDKTNQKAAELTQSGFKLSTLQTKISDKISDKIDEVVGAARQWNIPGDLSRRFQLGKAALVREWNMVDRGDLSQLDTYARVLVSFGRWVERGAEAEALRRGMSNSSLIEIREAVGKKAKELRSRFEELRSSGQLGSWGDEVEGTIRGWKDELLVRLDRWEVSRRLDDLRVGALGPLERFSLSDTVRDIRVTPFYRAYLGWVDSLNVYLGVVRARVDQWENRYNDTVPEIADRIRVVRDELLRRIDNLRVIPELKTLAANLRARWGSEIDSLRAKVEAVGEKFSASSSSPSSSESSSLASFISDEIDSARVALAGADGAVVRATIVYLAGLVEEAAANSTVSDSELVMLRGKLEQWKQETSGMGSKSAVVDLASDSGSGSGSAVLVGLIVSVGTVVVAVVVLLVRRSQSIRAVDVMVEKIEVRV